MFQGEYCGRRFHNGNRYVELCVSIELFVSELNHGPLLDYAAAHMKNGQRVSPDTVKLKKLLDSLSLSPHDYDVLWDNYLKARYGEQIHELHKNVISFLESFRKISRISIKLDFRHDIPEINTIFQFCSDALYDYDP